MVNWLNRRQSVKNSSFRATSLAGIALFCSLAGGGWLHVAQAQTPSADLGRLMADYDQFLLAQNPILAAQLGDLAAARKWPDDSPTAVEVRNRVLTGFSQQLAAISPDRLNVTEATNRAFMERSIQDGLSLASFDTERLPFSADSGFYQTPDFVARTTTIRSAQDADAWLARLDALPDFYNVELANARRGIATGYTQPAIVVEAVLRGARAQADAAPESSSLLAPFAQLPATISPQDQTALRARALNIVAHKIKPVQKDFARFLEAEYRPRARALIGVNSLPDGDRYYAFVVRSYTTTEQTPDQVHETGLAEVARIRAEMEQVKDQAKFNGSLPEFIAFLRKDKQFYVTDRLRLIEKVSTIAKRIDDLLPKYFATLPRLSYGVREVPRDIEESYTSGRYWEGSPERGIAGGYMINTSHLDQRPLFEMPSLTLHEAVPGHHLQIALGQENGDLPLFRRQSDMTVFIEGWALYAEKLGVEMGIYRTPYEHFGRLSFEMWRAARLVVDTGIHWKGWSREKARAFLADNTALGQKNVDVEIDRYIGWPGQALAYKTGEMKIITLRAKAQNALGAKFDLRRFHDAVLGGGALPLDLLEQRIDRWIASELAS